MGNVNPHPWTPTHEPPPIHPSTCLDCSRKTGTRKSCTLKIPEAQKLVAVRWESNLRLTNLNSKESSHYTSYDALIFHKLKKHVASTFATLPSSYSFFSSCLQAVRGDPGRCRQEECERKPDEPFVELHEASLLVWRRRWWRIRLLPSGTFLKFAAAVMKRRTLLWFSWTHGPPSDSRLHEPLRLTVIWSSSTSFIYSLQALTNKIMFFCFLKGNKLKSFCPSWAARDKQVGSFRLCFEYVCRYRGEEIENQRSTKRLRPPPPKKMEFQKKTLEKPDFNKAQ